MTPCKRNLRPRKLAANGSILFAAHSREAEPRMNAVALKGKSIRGGCPRIAIPRSRTATAARVSGQN